MGGKKRTEIGITELLKAKEIITLKSKGSSHKPLLIYTKVRLKSVSCDRQKRKLEEMYDALRKEYESVKRSAPPSSQNKQAVVQRANPYTFGPSLSTRHQLSGEPNFPPSYA